jgi:hypothetical protein
MLHSRISEASAPNQNAPYQNTVDQDREVNHERQ